MDGGGGGDDEARAATVDGEGNVIVTGYTTVRYVKKGILLPPEEEEPSTAISFIENRGQLADTSGAEVTEVRFYNTSAFPATYFQNDRLSFVTASIDTSTTTPDTLHRVDMTFKNGKNDARVFGIGRREAYHNYYLGHIPEGRARVGLYERAVQADIYNKIDLMAYSNNAGVKYYFIIKPGGGPEDIQLDLDGQSSLSVNGNEELVVGTSVGEFRLPQPKAYQVDSEGDEVEVNWAPEYVVQGDTLVSIGNIGEYDENKHLVIEVGKTPPETNPDGEDNLEWCTYFGGTNADYVLGSDVDESNTYVVTGQTFSTNFPIDGGQYDQLEGSSDAFITKFDDELNLIWSTYLGGTSDDSGENVMFNTDGKIIAVGETRGFGNNDNGANFPLKDNGTAYFDGRNACPASTSCSDCFISILSSSGLFEHITFYGSDGINRNVAYGLDIQENVYISGQGPIPVVNLDNSPLSETTVGGFISKFSPNLVDVEWATQFYNTSVNSIEVDANENIFVSGTFVNNSGINPVPVIEENAQSDVFNFGGGNTDAFGAKISSSPHDILWSTYIGGTGEEEGLDLTILPSGNVTFVGATSSNSGFPLQDFGAAGSLFDDTHGGGSDGFIAMYNNTGQLLASTYFGQSLSDKINAVEIDALGNIVLGAYIGPSNFNTVNFSNFFSQTSYGGGGSDGFILALNGSFEPFWSTYFGDFGTDVIETIAVSEDKLFLAGGVTETHANTTNDDFPLQQYTPNPQSYYVDFIGGPPVLPALFLARFSYDVANAVKENGTVHSAYSCFSVFPNPAATIVNVKPEGCHLTKLEIYDYSGRLVKTVATGSVGSDSQIEIDVRRLPAGLYLLKGTTEEGVQIQRIVVR